MEEILVVPRGLGWIAKRANALMVPIMFVLAGTKKEKPQHTHPWTVQCLTRREEGLMNELVMVHLQAVADAVPHHKWWDPRFHMPIFTGWRQYAVLDSNLRSQWYVGWRAAGGLVTEVSRIPQVGRVRVLLGPEDVSFFGVGVEGVQIPIYKVGEGKIGDGGPFCQVPLS